MKKLYIIAGLMLLSINIFASSFGSSLFADHKSYTVGDIIREQISSNQNGQAAGGFGIAFSTDLSTRCEDQKIIIGRKVNLTFGGVELTEEQAREMAELFGPGTDKNFIQRISKLFLEEDDSDEETLIDMLLETTNLIVGSAKVIAEESNENTYTINTPHFLKIDNFDFEYDEAKIIKVKNDEMIIAIKEL